MEGPHPELSNEEYLTSNVRQDLIGACADLETEKTVGSGFAIKGFSELKGKLVEEHGEQIYVFKGTILM